MYAYPEVYKPRGNGPPYYILGDQKFEFDAEMGTLLDSCQKLQTNLTLYQLCKQIKNGADVNCCDGGWSPLDVAYYQKNFTTLRVLLANCALVCNLASPLHLAIAAGCTKEVEQYLCKVHGFDVSKLPSLIGDRNYTDYSPCVEKTPPASTITTPTDEMVNGNHNENGQTISDYIFHYTPEMRTKVEANIEFMLHDLKYFDLDSKDCNTATTLHVACLKGNNYLMELLIKCGADLNMCNAKGYTPLLFACNSCNPEAVDLIIKLGCSINQFCKGEDGKVRGPLLHATIGIGKSSVKVVRKLLENGLDVHTRDACDRTALHLAALYGAADLVKELLAFGTDVNVQECMGKTPLYLACHHHHHEVIKILLDAGAKIDSNERFSDPLLVSVLKNIHQLKTVNPFNLYCSSETFTTQRLLLTLEHLINHGCRMPFLYDDNLMTQTYKHSKPVVRYLLSTSCRVPGTPERLGEKLAGKIIRADDEETIHAMMMAGINMHNCAENMSDALLNILYQPLSLKCLSRLTIRKCIADKIHENVVQEPTSKLKTFFRKFSLKPNIACAIPSSKFDELPLPEVLKFYLGFQDLVDAAFQMDEPFIESPAAQLHDQAAKLNADRRRFEKLLMNEVMKELRQETSQENQEKMIKLFGDL
jgi:ankyrin repeat protein